MNTSALLAIMAGVGLLSGIGQGIKALIDRRGVGANATAVVTAAARELVDPLRKELAIERAEHAAEIEVERAKVAELRSELQSAARDARMLRTELAAARREMDGLRTANEKHRMRIRALEQQIAGGTTT